MREIDEPIPPDERLFRSASPASLADGGHLLPSAVRLTDTSCNREKYGDARSVLTELRPSETTVVQTTPGQLPPPAVSPGGAEYAFRATDAPTRRNDAHAEVQLLHAGLFDRGHKVSSKPFAELLKERLGRAFSLVT